MTKLRVAVMASSNFETFPAGGTLTFLRSLMPRLKADVLRVGVVPRGTPLSARSGLDVVIGEVDPHSRVPMRLSVLLKSISAASAVGRFDPDVVYVHSAELAPLAVWSARVPIIYQMHGADTSTAHSRHAIVRNRLGTVALTSLSDYAVRHSTCVFGVNAACRAYAERMGREYSEIPPMVDLSRFCLGDADASRACKFVYSGKIEPVKNVPQIIQAFARVLNSLPCARLVIVGSGSQEVECVRLVNEMGLSEAVRLTGALSGEAIARELQSAGVFVLASHFEGLPTAMLEAMASGCVVCAPRIGGIPEVVTDGKTGILYSGDVASLGDAMKRAQGMVERIGDLGRSVVESRYSADIVAAQVTEHLQECALTRRGRR
jgi:glycosyltransferase involved in cell wall biosynthesis